MLATSTEYFFFSFLFKNFHIKIYKTIILHVLYGCVTWSEYRLILLGKIVLRRIF